MYDLTHLVYMTVYFVAATVLLFGSWGFGAALWRRASQSKFISGYI